MSVKTNLKSANEAQFALVTYFLELDEGALPLPRDRSTPQAPCLKSIAQRVGLAEKVVMQPLNRGLIERWAQTLGVA
jgi:hypothetical protein